MSEKLKLPREAVSKSEAISALQQVSEFARKAEVAFGDLRSRCGILEATIRHNSSDPLTEDQLRHFDKLINDWDAVAKTL